LELELDLDLEGKVEWLIWREGLLRFWKFEFKVVVFSLGGKFGRVFWDGLGDDGFGLEGFL
jgi:hypothetical protein